MPRVAAAVVLTALLLAGAPARADGPPKPPDAAKVRTAAEQFDAGMAALKVKDFEGAASHFEAADAAVPSPNALRQAIRARDKASQKSRAATLAAQALERYANDEATAKLAREIIEKHLLHLHKITVSCPSPCVLAIGARSVPGDASTRWTVFLDPAKDKDPISASFFGGVSSAPREIAAKAGGFDDIRLEPVEPKASPPPPPPPPVVTPDPPKKDPDPPPPVEAPPGERKGLSPIFFGVGAAVTAGMGATLIWSALDTQNNPGPDKVREACKGKGESCPTYQDALSKQRRTNIFIGVTAGTAAVTVGLAVFTRWRSPKKKDPEPAAFTWAPTAVVVDRGVVLGAAGVF